MAGHTVCKKITIGACFNMDLKELHTTKVARHPWETTRLKAIGWILEPYLVSGIKILDVGCGDAFVSRELFKHLEEKEITAVDVNFTDGTIQELESISDGIRFIKTLPEQREFDLVLLLDVIEHLENDKGMLSNLTSGYLSQGGKVLITVPAFQMLFSCHDEFIGHHRRYTLAELHAVSIASGLTVISSGYLFMSLLIPKYILYKILKPNNGSDGVGRWGKGKAVTRFIENIINIENYLLILASRYKLTLPGLTGWVLCEKQV